MSNVPETSVRPKPIDLKRAAVSAAKWIAILSGFVGGVVTVFDAKDRYDARVASETADTIEKGNVQKQLGTLAGWMEKLDSRLTKDENWMSYMAGHDNVPMSTNRDHHAPEPTTEPSGESRVATIKENQQ